MIEQRSLDWHKARLGFITASEFHNLMKNSKAEVPMTEAEIEAYKTEHPKAKNIPTTKKVEVPFSEATYTYLNRKLMERYIPKDSGTTDEYVELHDISNRAMNYGTDTESLARDTYAEIMGYEVMEVEFVPLKGYETICGASADGIVRNEKGGCEIKCPFAIEHHLEYMMLQSAADLLALKPEYYWQVRLNMLVWNLDWYDFISFCPYISKSKQMKVLRIFRDKEIDKEIFTRLDLATKYMIEKIEEINNIQMIIK